MGKDSGLIFGHQTVAQAVANFAANRAGPKRCPEENPRTEPPLDPSMHYRLREIEARISRKLRWYWMKEDGLFCIQMFDHKTNDWAGVCIVHRPDVLDPLGRAAFKVPDERDLKKFCEGFLEIKYGSGDVDQDQKLFRQDKDAYVAGVKKAEDDEMLSLLNLMLTQGDGERTEKVKQHIKYHGGNAGFKEHWQVHQSTPIVTVKK